MEELRKLISVKVEDLTPSQLNWMVAVCEGLNVGFVNNSSGGRPVYWRSTYDGDDDFPIPDYCDNYNLGVSIIERERIGVSPHSHQWHAIKVFDSVTTTYGKTLMIAGLRCYVMFKLGPVVEIPEGV